MARRVKGPKPGDLRLFVPTAFGNDKAIEDERVLVWIRNPTEQEKREATALADSVEYSPEDNKVTVDMSIVVKRVNAFVSLFVEKVENYEGPGGEPISDGETLLKHGETSLLLEVADEIEHATSLSEAERKNSQGPSVCSEAETSRSDGVAQSASGTASGKQETATEQPTTSSSTSPNSVECSQSAQSLGLQQTEEMQARE